MSLIDRLLRRPGKSQVVLSRPQRPLPQLSDGQVHELKSLIVSRPHWYQSWQIADNVKLPGYVDVNGTLDIFGVPEDLRGRKILDVGANNGAFSFEFERRGAEVTAVDICSSDTYAFESLARILQSRVPYIQATVYDLDLKFPASEFDYIWFCGVIYHLRHPLLALDKLYRLVKRAVWLESHVIDNCYIIGGKSQKLPQALRQANISQFYRCGEFGDDPSNWFGPSIACLESMLWSCGFRPTLRGSSEGTRVHFYAEKMAGPPEHERLLMEGHPDYYYKEGTK